MTGMKRIEQRGRIKKISLQRAKGSSNFFKQTVLLEGEPLLGRTLE